MFKIKFGGTSQEHDYLSDLVLQGIKQATSSLHGFQNQTSSQVGDIWQIFNSKDQLICTVKVTNVQLIPFGNISNEFAILEGDESYENWRHIHFAYYTNQLATIGKKLTDQTILECVFFEVVYNS